MTETRVAEVFPPGEFLKEELDARGWTQMDLAHILGRPHRLVNEIISSRRPISIETAKGLSAALGTSAQFWLNLETAWQLSQHRAADEAIARRSRLYSCFPVKDLLKRGWIEPSENIDILEQRFMSFFELHSLDESPSFAHAASKSSSYSVCDVTQLAWLFRARQLARAVSAARFTPRGFNECLARIRELLLNPEDVRSVPPLLASAGIRFLMVEHLPRTRIDGATFWLDGQSPVIVLSMRFDRIDHFWFKLLHELKHVREKEGQTDPIIDTDLVGEHAQPFDEKPQFEKDADIFAREFLIAREEMDDFVARVRPLYSKQRIRGFAARLGIHPGLVVGQLQHRREIPYSHSREQLVGIRDIVTVAALTDGWGHTLPPLSNG